MLATERGEDDYGQLNEESPTDCVDNRWLTAVKTALPCCKILLDQNLCWQLKGGRTTMVN